MTLPRRAVLLSLLLPHAARADGLDLSALMARLASVPERRATFREERTLAALTTPLVSTGTLRYRRPDYLEKDTLWPQPERMIIDGDRLIVSDPASNEPPHVVPLDVQPGLRPLIEAMRAPLAGDLGALRRSFAATVAGTPAAWTMTLTPADPAAAALIATVQVSGTADAVNLVRVAQRNGDATTLRITPADR